MPAQLVRINIQVEPGARRKLKSKLALRGLTISDWVRKMIEAELDSELVEVFDDDLLEQEGVEAVDG